MARPYPSFIKTARIHCLLSQRARNHSSKNKFYGGEHKGNSLRIKAKSDFIIVVSAELYDYGQEILCGGKGGGSGRDQGSGQGEWGGVLCRGIDMIWCLREINNIDSINIGWLFKAKLLNPQKRASAKTHLPHPITYSENPSSSTMNDKLIA